MSDTVLYIDDHHQLPERVDEILAQAGYKLVHTSDPDEALRIACEERPALVLTEVLLSDRDGFELIRSIHAAAIAPPLPIVVVTSGERTPQLYGQAIELGVEDFLCKPVVEAQILEAVLAFACNSEMDEPPAEASAPAAEFFEGNLEDQPLPQLLGRLHRAGFSGVLTLHRGSHTRSVQLRNGSPIEVEKHRGVEPVANYLHRTRRIDDEQYAMLEDQLMARIAGPREILLGMEALSEAQLEAANQEQALGVLLGMFDWASGRFTFNPDQQLTCPETLEVVCDPTKIVLGGLKRTSDDVIRAALDRRSDLYVSISESAESRLEALDLSPDQHANIESLVGDRTVAEVLASRSVDERMLYELYATGAVLLDDVPVLMLDQEVKPDEPVETRATPRHVDPIRKLPKQRPDKRQAEPPRNIEAKIEEIAERLDSRDDFGLFGIDEASRDVDVRSAYDTLLGHLRLSQIPSEQDDLRTRARELRLRLEQAYQRVRTADSRSAFAGIRKGNRTERREEEDGSRAVDAENWFRTGEGHLAHKNYDQAVEAFGMAVHLDPDQGDYAACLGYSLYRSQPESSVIRREALEHVAKGVKLAPGREKPLLFLSRIFRETGDLSMAAKVLRRALLSNPDSPALVQEMCLIKRSGSKPKAKNLLERLRRR